MKLEINHKKNMEKYKKTRKLDNILLNNQCVNDKIKEGIKRYLDFSALRWQRDRWEQSPLALNTSATPS